MIRLVSGRFFEANRQFGRTLCSRRDAPAQVEASNVHVLLVAHGDFEFVEVEEGHRNGGQVVEQRKQLRLFVGLARQLNPDFDAGLGAGLHGSSVLAGRAVKEVEANFIQPCGAKVRCSVGVKGDRGVSVNVVVGAEGSLQLTNRFKRLFQIKHWVAARDAGAGGVHGLSFFDDLLPRCAPTFVGEHVRRFSPVFRQRAVIAAPVAFAGDKQDKFAALLALNTSLWLTLLRREDFGDHGQTAHQATPLDSAACVNNHR